MPNSAAAANAPQILKPTSRGTPPRNHFHLPKEIQRRPSERPAGGLKADRHETLAYRLIDQSPLLLRNLLPSRLPLRAAAASTNSIVHSTAAVHVLYNRIGTCNCHKWPLVAEGAAQFRFAWSREAILLDFCSNFIDLSFRIFALLYFCTFCVRQLIR